MKKTFGIMLVLCLIMSLLAACGAAESSKPQVKGGTFTLFTWEGMFPQEILDGFTKETGYTINYNNFDYDETMLAKLQAAKGGDYCI